MLEAVLPFIDFVALDFKAPKHKFKDITNSQLFDEFEKSFDILSTFRVDFEVRTTYHSELLGDDDLQIMADFLQYKNYQKPWYVQNFIQTNGGQKVLKKSKKFENLKVGFHIYTR